MIILNIKIHNVIKDKEGRYIVGDIELDGVARFLIVEVYGPNQIRTSFYKTIFKLLGENEIRNLILCGD